MPWGNWTYYPAAEGGHLAVLQWARVVGCLWGATCAAGVGGWVGRCVGVMVCVCITAGVVGRWVGV